LLVPAGRAPFSDALEILCRNIELRARYGSAGRTRIEQHFQIETTVRPLIDLFEKQRCDRVSSDSSPFSVAHQFEPSKLRIAYLIDRWPDDTLRSIETELLEVRKRNLEVTAFVCEFAADRRLTAAMKRLALQLEFLPDAMAIEAEWQANRRLVLALEDDRAHETPRTSRPLFAASAFCDPARRMFAGRKFLHVHATNSRALTVESC
jgi:hypothetical protein